MAAYVGNIAICSLHGMMISVFPKYGSEIGVDSSSFGVLVAGSGLARSLVFVFGFWVGRRLRAWQYSLGLQLLAAAMVATVGTSTSHAWIGLVFVTVGLGLGATFYRALYMSLETPGSRGLKSGLHEAALLSGVLTGSLGGGLVAEAWGSRAPYVPLASFVAAMVIVQAALTAWAHRARTSALTAADLTAD
jgi:predicted MFS family arabinose efflux permease